jgi:hypothetical protein
MFSAGSARARGTAGHDVLLALDHRHRHDARAQQRGNRIRHRRAFRREQPIMTPRITAATGAGDLAYYRHLMDVAAEFTGDGRPSVGDDLLLEALRREHGVERADTAPETIPRPRRGQT